MSTAKETNSGSVRRQPPEEVRVTSWPLRDDPLRTWPVALAAVLVAVFAGWYAQSYAMGGATLAALWLALWRLWIPVTYDLTSRGVFQIVLGRSIRIRWGDLGRFETYRRGVVLLPHGETTPLGKLRGLYVPFGNQREAVEQLLDYYILYRPPRGGSTMRHEISSTQRAEAAPPPEK